MFRFLGLNLKNMKREQEFGAAFGLGIVRVSQMKSKTSSFSCGVIRNGGTLWPMGIFFSPAFAPYFACFSPDFQHFLWNPWYIHPITPDKYFRLAGNNLGTSFGRIAPGWKPVHLGIPHIRSAEAEQSWETFYLLLEFELDVQVWSLRYEFNRKTFSLLKPSGFVTH